MFSALEQYDQGHCFFQKGDSCALSIDKAKLGANKAFNQFNATNACKLISLNITTELASNTAEAQLIFNLL